MTFLDPGAFFGTDPTDEPIASGVCDLGIGEGTVSDMPTFDSNSAAQQKHVA